jgi:hypothetical protein
MVRFILSAKGALVLDWAGSLLMLGTVWAWMHEQIDATVVKRLTDVTRARETFLRELDDEWERRQEAAASYAPPAEGEEGNVGCFAVLATIPAQIAFYLPVVFLRGLRALVTTILVGSVGKSLFAVGLLMWNASKLISYVAIP